MQYTSLLYQWEPRACKMILGMLLNISPPCLASWLDAMWRRLQSHAQQLLRAILADSGVYSLLPSPLTQIPCIEGSSALITGGVTTRANTLYTQALAGRTVCSSSNTRSHQKSGSAGPWVRGTGRRVWKPTSAHLYLPRRRSVCRAAHRLQLATSDTS